MAPQQTESPFSHIPQKRQLSFGTLLIMLFTTVAAGVGLLVYNAFKVPAITSELNAWFGISTPPVDVAESHKAQIIFVLFCYSAPLLLGIFVNFFHQIVVLLNRYTAPDDQEDDPFRMEK